VAGVAPRSGAAHRRDRAPPDGGAHPREQPRRGLRAGDDPRAGGAVGGGGGGKGGGRGMKQTVRSLRIPLLRGAVARQAARVWLRRAAREVGVSPKGLPHFL